jgi:VPDSG-CTERM motif
MKLMKPLLASLTAMVVAAGFALSAQATQITGTIGFTDPNGGTVKTVSGTTTVHLNTGATVNFGTDTYSTILNGTSATFKDIAFTGSGTSSTLTASVTPAWLVVSGANNFSFDLTSLFSTSMGVMSGVHSFTLSGSGVAHATGFEDTNAVFSLQGTGSGAVTFTIFQASTTAIPGVPDGGSAVALLGLGLVAVEALRRKVRAS